MKIALRIVLFVFFIASLIIVVMLIPESAPKPGYLSAQLASIEKLIEHRDEHNLKVSQANVAWHLDHTLKVVNKVCQALERSDPEKFQTQINLTKEAVYLMGKIPRGKGKAVASVLPPDTIKTADILAQLAEAREYVEKIIQYDEKSNFKHPYFGMLNRNETARFIEIHTKHHLKIIEDIIARP